MSLDGRLLRVAVPTPVRKLFDYLAPADDAARPPAPGYRVRVPFGRGRGKAAVGLVMEHPSTTDVPVSRLRTALEILDTVPLIDAELLAVLQWAATYYHHAPGEVVATALPGPLRKGAPATLAPTLVWRVQPEAPLDDLDRIARRAPRQAAVLAVLARAPGGLADATTLDAALTPGWRPTMRRLVEVGHVAQVPLEDAPPDAPAATPPSPTAEQTQAIESVVGALGTFRPFLLHGVTGSGKTEVYLRVIEQVLSRGEQALVLVPEIGLTPQLVDRLRQRLATRVVVMHSGLSDGDRTSAWLAAKDGTAGVILGTRSSVFVPLPRPGVIVVDEEQDASFKQQDGFRYHARDLAVFRAQRLGIPIVLGSATPAFETLRNASENRYTHLRLTHRAGGGVAPDIRLIDLRRDAPAPGTGSLSASLVGRMRSHLAEGSQVLLFLNRRGYAPVYMCLECGWQAHCVRCDARLTYHHRAGRLVCHHCGYQTAAPTTCPDCLQPGTPRPIGAGTEQVEQALQDCFPGVSVARIDRDSVRRKGELDERLAAIRSGETRILIGTQMLTKGHDFPNVTLVGVLNADGGLFSSDFRAPERLAQLTVQVAGRAGRARSGGEVMLQTSFPEHPLLGTLLREGYDGFAREAMAEREAAGWPPYQSVTLLRAESVKAPEALRFLEEVALLVRRQGATLAQQVEVLGPAPATMERRAGRFRGQLLFRAARRAPLHALLDWLLGQVEQLPTARRVRWSVDVDPVDLD